MQQQQATDMRLRNAGTSMRWRASMASPCGLQVQTPDLQPDDIQSSTVSVAALECSAHALLSGTSGNTQQHMHIMNDTAFVPHACRVCVHGRRRHGADLLYAPGAGAPGREPCSGEVSILARCSSADHALVDALPQTP